MAKGFDARSYSAAETFPMKILTNLNLLETALKFKKIVPIHLQLCPTNKCNFDCSMCSCSSRDKSLEIPVDEIYYFMREFKALGGESVTITGGGEPLLHKNIGSLIDRTLGLGIKIGIVTNGSLWHRVVESSRKFDKVTWVRVSSSDNLHEQLERLGKDFSWWMEQQDSIVRKYPTIDWAFSHVVTEEPELTLIGKLIRFANKHKFTHVRLVSNILKAELLSGIMGEIKKSMRHDEINDSIVNYQDRATYVKGTNPCFISLLKPVLAADGKIYPCCGVQYALKKPSRDFEPTMNMGSMDEFTEMINAQEFFDGSSCVKCYYHNYNDALGTLVNGIKHKEFI